MIQSLSNRIQFTWKLNTRTWFQLARDTITFCVPQIKSSSSCNLENKPNVLSFLCVSSAHQESKYIVYYNYIIIYWLKMNPLLIYIYIYQILSIPVIQAIILRCNLVLISKNICRQTFLQPSVPLKIDIFEFTVYDNSCIIL